MIPSGPTPRKNPSGPIFTLPEGPMPVRKTNSTTHKPSSVPGPSSAGTGTGTGTVTGIMNNINTSDKTTATLTNKPTPYTHKTSNTPSITWLCRDPAYLVSARFVVNLPTHRPSQKHKTTSFRPQFSDFDHYGEPSIPSPSPQSSPLQYGDIFSQQDLSKTLMIRRRFASIQLSPDTIKTYGIIPKAVNSYHSLYPLQRPPSTPPTSGSATSPSSLFSKLFSSRYRGTNIKTGLPYCLSRYANISEIPPSGLNNIPLWRQISHPSIISFRDTFTTDKFRDSSLIFIHDFVPGLSIYEKLSASHGFLSSTPQNTTPHFTPCFSHDLITRFVLNIVPALAEIHEKNLACRVVHATKIHIDGFNYFRLSSCAILDVLFPLPGVGNHHISQNMQYNNTKLHTLHKDSLRFALRGDLFDLGRTLVELATNCSTQVVKHHMSHALEKVASFYGDTLYQLCTKLLTMPNLTISEVQQIILPLYVKESVKQLRFKDTIVHNLEKSFIYERLFRLMVQIGFITERGEFKDDPRWSESGDMYTVKLFRDYLLHQTDSNENPVLSLPHVINNLNLLDSGSQQEVMLTTRDNSTILLASFDQIKQSIRGGITQLSDGNMTPSTFQPTQSYAKVTRDVHASSRPVPTQRSGPQSSYMGNMAPRHMMASMGAPAQYMSSGPNYAPFAAPIQYYTQQPNLSNVSNSSSNAPAHYIGPHQYQQQHPEYQGLIHQFQSQSQPSQPMPKVFEKPKTKPLQLE